MNQQALPPGPSLRTSPVIDTVDLDLDLVVFGGEDVDVGLAEDDKEVALAGVLHVGGHVEVGVHPGLEHRNAAKAVEV